MFMRQVSKSYIYVIENIVNGHAYVGKANDVMRRWKKHIVSSLQEKSELPLHRAIRKYGLESFVVHVAEEHESEKYVLEILESDWISYLSGMGISLYNLTLGGDGLLGFKHSIETIERMKEKHKGKIISEETKLKISEKLIGQIVSEEVRLKISMANKGKKKPIRSEAHKAALSRAASKKKYSEERRKKLSESMKASSKVGHPVDEETRRKISEKLKNQVQSEETKRKRAESLRNQTSEMKEKRGKSIKEAWARRKAEKSSALNGTFLTETSIVDAEDVRPA